MVALNQYALNSTGGFAADRNPGAFIERAVANGDLFRAARLPCRLRAATGFDTDIVVITGNRTAFNPNLLTGVDINTVGARPRRIVDLDPVDRNMP